MSYDWGLWFVKVLRSRQIRIHTYILRTTRRLFFRAQEERAEVANATAAEKGSEGEREESKKVHPMKTLVSE